MPAAPNRTAIQGPRWFAAPILATRVL